MCLVFACRRKWLTGLVLPLDAVGALAFLFKHLTCMVVAGECTAVVAVAVAVAVAVTGLRHCLRSEEHTSELQSLMRISYAVFCLQQKITQLIILLHIKT